MKRCEGNPILVEDYLSNAVSKANRIQMDNKLNQIIDHCAQLHKYEQLNKMEIEGNETVPGTIQSPRDMKTDHTKW